MSVPEVDPWVYWCGVGGAVVTAVSLAVPKLREALSPLIRWVSDWRVRRIERQARIEQAAEALNDQRNRLLSVQVSGLSAQLEAVLRQGERDAERRAEEVARHAAELAALREQLTDTQAQLAAQTLELAALRAELAEYRGTHG